MSTRNTSPNTAASVADSYQPDWVSRACALLDGGEVPIPLSELAQACGVSASHLQRVFKASTGLTPKQYAMARQRERAQAALQQGEAVTDAVYTAGFNASSRFYEQAPHMLGMAPSRYRQGGAGEAIRFAVAQCDLGAILVAASAQGLCAISLGDDAETLVRELQARFAQAELAADDPQFDAWVAQVVALVQAPGVGLSLPLDLRGTLFQRQVWQVLRGIPPGQTLSYAQVAERLGQPKAARAVARACAANAVALAVPCHRVVRGDGGLSGYRWGVDRKRALLLREGAQVAA